MALDAAEPIDVSQTGIVIGEFGSTSRYIYRKKEVYAVQHDEIRNSQSIPVLQIRTRYI